MEENFRKRIEEERTTGKPRLIVGELEGRAIALISLDLRPREDGLPRLHFHILEPALRGQGLGGVLFEAGLGAIHTHYGFRRFMIEPRSTNGRMNGLMRKLGFRFVKTFVLESGLVTQEMRVSQYEITFTRDEAAAQAAGQAP